VVSPGSGEDAIGARHQPAFRTAELCPAPWVAGVPGCRRCSSAARGCPVARPILLATLLHEAAHALAHIRRIRKDTS